MALVADLKSCLMWETERPYLGVGRQSSYFRMFAEEWYLHLSLEDHQHNKTDYLCSIRLHRRKGAKALEMPVSSSCDVIIESMTFCDSSRTVRYSGDLILCNCVLKSDLSPSENPKNWKIICRLSCDKPLSLQIGNNETIHLSTVKDGDSPPKSIDRCVQVSPEIPRDIDSLSSDFSSLLEDGIFPDFELKCGGRSFPVHRSVLSARSEVFRAMFRSRMLESETGSADIKDLEVPVLESLLKFIYSGKLEQVSEDTISKTYEAADKYAVHCLKMACSYWMKRNLVEENCVSFLDIANSHSDHDLRATVVSFLIQHPRLLKSTAWLTFSKQHQELAIEVLQTYVSSTVQ